MVPGIPTGGIWPGGIDIPGIPTCAPGIALGGSPGLEGCEPGICGYIIIPFHAIVPRYGVAPVTLSW